LKENDTLEMNLRIPFNSNKHEIIDKGIFYNCHLKPGTVYTITLKKICTNDIVDVPNSYYKTNIIPEKKNCSRFTEIEKNTRYEYKGNYGKYIDFKNTLYEIIDLTPNGDCAFQH